MSQHCELLDRFVDGELSDGEADQFRDHLADCDACQRGLHDRMQLDRLAATKAAPVAEVRAISSAKKWRRPAMMAGAAVAASLAAMMLINPCRTPAETPTALALASTRAVEGRLSLAAAREHRPYNVARDRNKPESVPLATLAELEGKGAYHEMASIYLAAGDLDRATEFLDRAGARPGTDSDRAVIALARRKPAEAIDLLERALEQDGSDAAARWNRALALADLGLELTAATVFEQLAASQEPGWSDEAATRARQIREASDRRRASMAELDRAGKAMVETGTPIPDALVDEHPDHARRWFYEAVRSAPDQAFLRRLSPVAARIDQLAGGHRMSDRLATFEPKRRDAAAAYRALVLGTRPTDVAAFLQQMRDSNDPNLVIGALYALGPFPAKETAELVRLAEADGDPWFRLLAAQEDAARLRNDGKPFDAEARLLALESLCTTADRSLSLRCSLRDHFLGEGYAAMHRLDQARVRAASERARVKASRDWNQEGAVLPLEAQLALLDGSYALAKAYLDETSARRPGECPVDRFAHLALAQAAQNQLRPDRARAELDAAPRCDQPLSIAALNVEADLVRSEPKRVAATRKELAALRASATGSDLAHLDFLEGRLLSTIDPGTAEPVLRKAIAGDDAKVRGYAFSTLAIMASTRGDHAAVVSLLAEEVKQPAPKSCALAIALDDERLAIAIISATGVAAGSYTAKRAGAVTPSELVPGFLVEQLRACPEVAVFARPPLQGRAGILPPGVAFSFRDGERRTDGVSSTTRVVIAAEDPPASLGLPKLAGAGPVLPGEQRIEGNAATPERSLAAMRDAGELIIHAHGLVDLAVSAASHLVLSRDPGGNFALTADAIAAQQLTGKPIVVLAACRAAQPAAQVHEAWSLPSAFLRAGARAVFASTEPIPDRESAAFFDEVLREIREKKSPAVALESVRSRRRVAGTSAWFESVVVFE